MSRLVRKRMHNTTIVVRLSEQEKNRIEDLAEQSGMSLSEFVRNVLLQCAKSVSDGDQLDQRLRDIT